MNFLFVDARRWLLKRGCVFEEVHGHADAINVGQDDHRLSARDHDAISVEAVNPHFTNTMHSTFDQTNLYTFIFDLLIQRHDGRLFGVVGFIDPLLDFRMAGAISHNDERNNNNDYAKHNRLSS